MAADRKRPSPKRGTFERVTRGGYVPTSCWLHGPFAIHEVEPEEVGRYTVSHARTGLRVPLVFAPTIKEAAAVCDEIADLVDWTRMERGKQPGRPRGMPKPQGMRRVVQALRDLSNEVAFMLDSVGVTRGVR
jgi:hypothetical protein